jgi:O-glycosyl hydrolase
LNTVEETFNVAEAPSTKTKTSKAEGGGGGGQFMNGRLRPDMYAAWAQMFVAFAKEYSKRGVKLWGLTMQNEAQSTATWEAMLWTTEEAVSFMADHLGPLIRNTTETNHIKIMAHGEYVCLFFCSNDLFSLLALSC